MVLGPVGRGRRGSPERVPNQACAEGCPPRRCSSGTYPPSVPCLVCYPRCACYTRWASAAAELGTVAEPEAAQLRHADVPIAPLPLVNPHGTISRTIACLCVCSLSPLSLSLSLSLLLSQRQPAWAILRPLSGPTCSAGNGVYVLPSPPAHAFRLLAPLRARACSRSASHTLCFVRCEVGARPTPQPYTSHPPNFSPTPHHHPPPPPPPTTRRSRSRGRTTFTLNRRT